MVAVIVVVATASRALRREQIVASNRTGGKKASARNACQPERLRSARLKPAVCSLCGDDDTSQPRAGARVNGCNKEKVTRGVAQDVFAGASLRLDQRLLIRTLLSRGELHVTVLSCAHFHEIYLVLVTNWSCTVRIVFTVEKIDLCGRTGHAFDTRRLSRPRHHAMRSVLSLDRTCLRAC